VLDAGCGNGYFSWLAYRTGARVVAINVDPGQVGKAKSFLIGFKQAAADRLHFEVGNLYGLKNDSRSFDEIICYETLEHILGDKQICQSFYRVLRPGGVLHLCCPNKLHPRHAAEVLDTEEKGGHVRPGYTEEEYRRLLEPIGFKIDAVVGVGNGALFRADRLLRRIRARVGDYLALPMLPAFLPVLKLNHLNPAVPFSLYVRATKDA
jgi:SAM-dependent methyltransferase